MYICPMFIGNIITENTLDYECLNKFSSIEEVNNDMPTLILGYKNIKDKYHNYTISNRTLNNNLYWTFDRLERRDLYEKDLYDFNLRCIERLTKDIKYVFVDTINFKISTIKRIIGKIKLLDIIFLHENNRMIYLGGNNLIFGLDKKLLEFTGVKYIKLLSKLDRLGAIRITTQTIKKEKHIFNLLNQEEKYWIFIEEYLSNNKYL